MHLCWFLSVVVYLDLAHFFPNHVSSKNLRRSLLNKVENKAQNVSLRAKVPLIESTTSQNEAKGLTTLDRSLEYRSSSQLPIETQLAKQNFGTTGIRLASQAGDEEKKSITLNHLQALPNAKGNTITHAGNASASRGKTILKDKTLPFFSPKPDLHVTSRSCHQSDNNSRPSENQVHELPIHSHLAPPYYPEHLIGSMENHGLNTASDPRFNLPLGWPEGNNPNMYPAGLPEGYALREINQPVLIPGYFQTKAPVVIWQDFWQFAYQPANIVHHQLVQSPQNFQFPSETDRSVVQGQRPTVHPQKAKSGSNQSRNANKVLTGKEKLIPPPKTSDKSLKNKKVLLEPLVGTERPKRTVQDPSEPLSDLEKYESSLNASSDSPSSSKMRLKNLLIVEKEPPQDPLGFRTDQGIGSTVHVFQKPELIKTRDGLTKTNTEVIEEGKLLPPSKTGIDYLESTKATTKLLIESKTQNSPLQVDPAPKSNFEPDTNALKSPAGSTSTTNTDLENKGVTGTKIDQQMSEKSDNLSLKMATQGATFAKKNMEEKSPPEGKKPVPSGSYSISRSPQESSGNQMPKAQVESFSSFKSPESDLNTILTKSERHVSLNSPDSNFWNKNFLQAIAAQKPEKLGNMHHRKVGIALKAKSPRESKSTVTEIRGGINEGVTAPYIPSIEHSRVMNERQGAVKNYTPSLGLQRTGDFIKNNNQGSSQDKDGWTLVQNKRKKLVSPGSTHFQLMNSAEDGRMEIPPGEVDKHSEKLGLSEAQKRPMSLQTPPNSSFEKSQKESQNSLVEKAITEPDSSLITKNRQQVPSENSQKQPKENDERENQQGPDTIEKAKKKSSKNKKKANKGSKKAQTSSLSRIKKQQNAEKTFLDDFEAPKEFNTFNNEKEREDPPLGKALTLPPTKSKKTTRFDFESTAVSSLKSSQQALGIKPEITLIQVETPDVDSLPTLKKEIEIVWPHLQNVFEPWEEGRQTSEIFPNIIKPQGKLRDAEVTKKNKRIKTLLKRKGDEKKLEEWQEMNIKNYHLANEMAQHLKVDNHEEHLALESMSLDLYQLLRSGWQPTAEGSDVLKLQFWARRRCLGDVEGSRRVWTLSRQIFKHTIVENWKIIKKSLVKNNELSFSEADIIERVCQLSDLTPDFVTIANTFPEGPFLSAKVGKENTVGSLLRILMGPEETNVRTAHMKINQESARWWENTTIAKAAEQHGLDVWRVIEIAEALHLRSEDDLAYQLESTEAEKVIETLKSNILRGKGEFFSWPDSPERAWLVQQFGELFQRRLNYVCEQARGRLEVPSAPQITLHPADLLQWYDSGLDPQMLGSIRSAIARHTMNGITNWEALFSERSKPLTEQQKLVFMRWFETEKAVKAEPGQTNAAKHNRSKSL